MGVVSIERGRGSKTGKDRHPPGLLEPRPLPRRHATPIENGALLLEIAR